VKTYYAPGLDKVFGMFQLTYQTQQAGNKQQYETGQMKKWKTPLLTNNNYAPHDIRPWSAWTNNSHFVHGPSDSPEDILKWCRIYSCTLTVFLKKSAQQITLEKYVLKFLIS
jgi:hypothetical protein